MTPGASPTGDQSGQSHFPSVIKIFQFHTENKPWLKAYEHSVVPISAKWIPLRAGILTLGRPVKVRCSSGRTTLRRSPPLCFCCGSLGTFQADRESHPLASGGLGRHNYSCLRGAVLKPGAPLLSRSDTRTCSLSHTLLPHSLPLKEMGSQVQSFPEATPGLCVFGESGRRCPHCVSVHLGGGLGGREEGLPPLPLHRLKARARACLPSEVHCHGLNITPAFTSYLTQHLFRTL